jgi:uncharacterized protein DUF3108
MQSWRSYFVFSAAVGLTIACRFAFAVEARPVRPVAPAQSSAAASSPLAVFAEGESLTYIAKLNELPAGDAAIRLRKEQQEGRNVYRVTAQGRTNELVDFLVQLRGEADGLFAANGGSPIMFRLAYTERERSRELGVRYDPETKTLVGTTKKKERSREQREAGVGLYDPISAFYVLRSHELTAGASQQVDVFTGKDRYQIVAHVVRKENIMLEEREHPAIRLHLEGFRADDSNRKNVFPEQTTLWVSPDALHVPLRLESLLPLGVFVMELNGR